MNDHSGLTRKIDKVGRVSIPTSVRESVGLLEGDQVEFGVVGNRIYMERYSKTCIICGTNRNIESRLLTGPKPKPVCICQTCLTGIKSSISLDYIGEEPKIDESLLHGRE